jgi:hypothetical protein
VDYNDTLVKAVQGAVDELFEKTKLQFLGPKYAKSFVFSMKEYDPSNTIQSIYVNSAMTHSPTGQLDHKLIDKVADHAEVYIDKLKESVNADVTRLTGNVMSDINLQAKVRNIATDVFIASDDGQLIIKNLFTQLDDLRKKTASNLERIVSMESMSAQNYGAVDGIIEAAKAIGQSDPVIFKITYDHPTRCANCERLHLLTDVVTPRVYKLSEVAAATDFKHPIMSISPPHPHCYCKISVLSLGFTFVGGKITYKGKNEAGILWNEWEFQRNGNGWVKSIG